MEFSGAEDPRSAGKRSEYQPTMMRLIPRIVHLATEQTYPRISHLSQGDKHLWIKGSLGHFQVTALVLPLGDYLDALARFSECLRRGVVSRSPSQPSASLPHVRCCGHGCGARLAITMPAYLLHETSTFVGISMPSLLDRTNIMGGAPTETSACHTNHLFTERDRTLIRSSFFQNGGYS